MSLNNSLSKAESLDKIKDGRAIFTIDLEKEGGGPSELGDAEYMNEILVDDYFYRGCYLSDIDYKWEVVEGHICITINADATEWQGEIENEDPENSECD